MTFLHFIGVDVSKDWFDVARAGEPGQPQRFDNRNEDIARFVESLAERRGTSFVVLEATGGYERALVVALVTAGVAIHRAAPWQARSFARSLGKKAKTDGLDAKALARMAAERHTELRTFVPPSHEQSVLTDLMTRRADLLAMRTAEKARAAHPRYRQAAASVGDSLTESLAFFDRQIARIDAEIDALVDAADSLNRRVARMTTQIGVGETTALTLQAFLPELGALTRRAAASLAGCAPHARDTGQTHKKRTVFGGRASVKRVLFTAAMSARNHDPNMRAFFERLVANGKCKMVALVAVMRKIIVQLNAKLRPLPLPHHGR
jgi:transposase